MSASRANASLELRVGSNGSSTQAQSPGGARDNTGRPAQRSRVVAAFASRAYRSGFSPQNDATGFRLKLSTSKYPSAR